MASSIISSATGILAVGINTFLTSRQRTLELTCGALRSSSFSLPNQVAMVYYGISSSMASRTEQIAASYVAIQHPSYRSYA
jgi:hypothetical protein